VGYPDFFKSVRIQMEQLREDLAEPRFLQSLHMDRDTFDQEWDTFERAISLWIKQAGPDLVNLARGGLRNRKNKALESRLRYMFYAQVYGGRFTAAEQENQKQVADLRYPAEWYPATREIPRTVHLTSGQPIPGKRTTRLSD
jgi:ATP-dependent RNA helicase SUPV3L1/SUV3